LKFDIKIDVKINNEEITSAIVSAIQSSYSNCPNPECQSEDISIFITEFSKPNYFGKLVCHTCGNESDLTINASNFFNEWDNLEREFRRLLK